MKNYTLRVVKPWIVDGKKIGYIELGKEINKMIDELSKLLNAHIYLALKKDVYANAPKSVLEGFDARSTTAKYYIAYATGAIPKNIEAILDGSFNDSDIDLNDKKYHISLAPLMDVSNENLGKFLFLSDVSRERALVYSSIKILIIFLTLLTSILLLAGFTLINNRENHIFNLTRILDKKNEKLQKLFDIQKNITLISDGKTTLLANQAMLDFFNVGDLDEFQKYARDVSEKFIAANGYFNLDKVPNDQTWLDAIEPLVGDEKIVTLQGADGMPHAFNVSISQYEKEQYLVSLTDISATMIEKIDLSKQIDKDELTNAFNRKFFNKNISSIIKRLDQDAFLGVAMLDIDHFKKVNDAHGHNTGDMVLRQFSRYIKSSIRADDFLIRWGGEEFIVLITTTSNQALLRAAEHIRQVIQNADFVTVGNITCSVGVTLYIPGENINDAIERADNAMYRSKDAGRNRVSQLETVSSETIEMNAEARYIKAVLDENAIIIDFERNVLDKDGYAKEEVLGKNWFEIFIDVSDMDKTMDYFHEAVSAEDGKIARHANDVNCKDGTHRLLEFDNTIFTKDGKKYISFVAKERFSS